MHLKRKYPLYLGINSTDSYLYYAFVLFIVITVTILLRKEERDKQVEERTNSTPLLLDIHLLLYERVGSANLLLQAISQPTYPSSTDLFIHIDRSKSEQKHAKIEALAHDYHWRFGSKFIISPNLRLGLKKTWLSINPNCSKVRAIAVFEDDVIPSGGWFSWASFIISEYDKSIQRRDSILGFSLSSLKLNELRFPFETWSPVSTNGYYFLHQTPSSWGSVFLCRPWQEFREYAAARMDPIFDNEEIGGVSLDGGRPGDPNFHILELHSNWWSASWKKYMVEFGYAKGMLTVYPNLKLQNVGLVLNLAKNGEHMKDGKQGRNKMFEETEIASFPDIREAIRLTKSGSLDTSALFDIHFQPASLKKMKDSGKGYISSLQEKGSPYSDIASLLFSTSCYVKKGTNKKYLGYMPQKGQGSQLLSLAKAIALSIVLKRILLIPHVFLPSKTAFDECREEFCLEVSDVLSLTRVSNRRKDFKFVFLTSENFRLFKPDCIFNADPLRRPYDERYWTYFSLLPEFRLKSVDMKTMMRIRDRVLFLNDLSPITVPEHLVQAVGRELYYPNTRLRRVVLDLMHQFRFESGNFACVHLPIKGLKSKCNENSRFRDNSRYLLFRNQGYSCLPSEHHVSCMLSSHAVSQKVFLSTDDFNELRDFVGEQWDSEIIKSSMDTLEYLRLRFPKADQKFIEALHVFADQYICILAEKSILSRFSSFSYQVELNRDRNLVTEFWLREDDPALCNKS